MKSYEEKLTCGEAALIVELVEEKNGRFEDVMKEVESIFEEEIGNGEISIEELEMEVRIDCERYREEKEAERRREEEEEAGKRREALLVIKSYFSSHKNETGDYNLIAKGILQIEGEETKEERVLMTGTGYDKRCAGECEVMAKLLKIEAKWHSIEDALKEEKIKYKKIIELNGPRKEIIKIYYLMSQEVE